MKLTIIVPVYNGGKYLRACLDSIIDQSFRDYECIMIDDGSVDDSYRILLEYVEKDARFHAYTQKNQGVSATRNRGLDLASGEYVAFVDCDDYLFKTAYETVFSNMRGDTDVYCFGIRHLLLNGISTEDCTATVGDLDWMFINHQIYMHSPVNKVIKRALIEENAIRFDRRISTGEDMVFCFQMLSLAQSVEYSNIPLYCYRRNEFSATMKNWDVHSLLEQARLWSETLCSFCEQHRLKREHDTYLSYRELVYYSFYLLNKELYDPHKFRSLNVKKLEWKYSEDQGLKRMVKLANGGHYFLLRCYRLCYRIRHGVSRRIRRIIDQMRERHT